VTEPVAIAWYTRGAWLRAKRLSADPERLEDTYEAWLRAAAAACADLAGLGLEVVRVQVDVDDLARWCRCRQLPVDEEARARFTAEKARLLAGGAASAPSPVP